MVIIDAGSNVKDSTSCQLLCAFFFLTSDDFRETAIHFPISRLCFNALWLSLKDVCVLFLPPSLSPFLFWPPGLPLTLTLLMAQPGSLVCLHPLHTCIVPAHTMTVTLLTMKVFFSVDFLMSPRGICRSNQRWQRKCNPGVRKLERMQKCLFIVWKGHWPTLLPRGWWVGRKCWEYLL